MALKRTLKWLAILAAVLLLLLVVAVLTFPYWFGAALRPAGQRFGVSFAKYEKLKDGRFALTDVVRTNAAFDLRISRVEGFLPHVWYRKVHETSTNEIPAFAEVNGWRVVVHPQKKRADERAPKERDSYDEWKRIEHYIALARQWVPKALLLNGIVVYGGKEYTFPLITWKDGDLDAGGVWPVSAVPFEIKGKLSGEPPYQISYMMTPLDLRVRLQLRETNDFLNTKLALFYKENRVDLNANFAHDGLLPVTATLKAPSLKIPADLLKIKGYEDLTGSLSAEWKTNAYVLSLKAHGEPFAAATNAVPIDIALSAHGDTNSIFIANALSTAPGLQFSVSQPMEMSYEGKLLSDRAEVRVDADLSKVPGLKLKGTLKGLIILEKGSKFPLATLHVEGSSLAGYNITAEALRLDARVNWPMIEDLNAELRLQSNAVLSIHGAGDMQKRVLGVTTIEAEGPVGTNFLPLGVNFSSLRLKAEISGALTNLAHSAQCEIRDFSAPQVTPVHLDVSWKGHNLAFDQLALRARAGPASLWLAGSGNSSKGKTNFIVRELRLSKGDETYLSLKGPAELSVKGDGAGNERVIQLAPMILVGTNKQLVLSTTLTWPHAGRIQVQAHNIHPELFQAFTTHSLRGLELPELNLAIAWDKGPLYGDLSGNFSIEQETLKRVGAAVDLKLDDNGLTLTRLSLSDPSGEICRASGFLPLSVRPLETNKLRLSKRDQLDFQLITSTNTAFWNTVASVSKVYVTNAAVRLNVHGTTRRPTGDLYLKADFIGYHPAKGTNRELPEIGPVEARFTLNEQILKIGGLSFSVAGQPVSVTGRMELGENFWTQRREELVNYTVQHADVRVEAPEVNLAPFTVYLPKYLSPQGHLAIDAALKPGRNLQGQLTMRGLETRPIEKVGVIQAIRADVALRGKKVEIQNFSGVIGGQRLSVEGSVDVSEESLARSYPTLDLRIFGTDVPLARNPDVILRSDLDLHVRNGTNQVPVITGDATLRDSFLLRDISTLVPGRVAGPKRRPPYFSVEQEPIDDWRLRVRVRGDNFMRVRSPFFQGIVSANFLVNGTLREPVALGEASITSGSVLFPFATLEVRQAIVSMTSEDPFLPHIFMIANGRAFGFDIRMEADGPADQPLIQFSSVPALSSEQIVLMVTTGQIPREDFGFSTQDRAGKLAFFVGKSLWSKLHPGQPGEQRLTVRSGEDVTEQGRQTYEVEYKLSDRWSLVGEYDRFGAVNANVKWKLFSR